ncbi:hypothetical protein AXZ77_1878 [Thioclava sp. ES.031]|uniref:hypothetical protein n=1 Tax=Thioclava sp. ES.031 TaxID=1798203 RepID=UPI000BFA5DC4|nr:hypothetical protein [Thioclava sp. ES.031]PFG63273.1 hypothetical protein AXZ77_1878 [Thioclava sp. ES.031]
MKRIFAAAVVASLSFAQPAQSDEPTQRVQADQAKATLFSLADPKPALFAACCKHCSKGKACGDSCISRSKTCHRGPGCACD